MVNAKITHVVSFSSEDSSFPAENLTTGLTYKKWKCKTKGEPQSFVILQLEKAVTICGVDIGNECSAFVEVLVGRSGGAVDDFQALVPASSFMSAMESKNVTSTNRVRIFGPEALTKPACSEKWDRVKVICTQPFNKTIQYGLAFLTVHVPDNKDSSAEIGSLGRFSMKKNDIDDISIGSLFSKPKDQDSYRGVAGQIRDANRTSQTSDQQKQPTVNNNNEIPRIKIKDTLEAKKKTSLAKKTVTDDERPSGSKDKAKVNTTTPKRKASKTDEEKPSGSKDKAKVNTTPKRKAAPPPVSPRQRPKRAKAAPPKLRKPFAKLLDGVVFVISGYQNPNRQILRDKALAMGAKYKPDWCPGCTHLICAFPNTPKFNQVRGQGKIIGKQWIEDCHAERKRFPWRQYAVDRNDKGKDESEEEICEDVPIAVTSTSRQIDDEDDFTGMTVNNARCLDSGSDTDDEIERVKQLSLREAEEKLKKENEVKKVAKKKEELVKKGLVIAESPEETDEELERLKRSQLEAEEEAKKLEESYNATSINKPLADISSGSDTEKDELAPEIDTSNLPLPRLPEFFKDKTFYLHNELSEDSRAELIRYVTAYGGEVLDGLDNPHIDYLLAEYGADVEAVKTIYPDIAVVAPEWVWACNDAEKLFPPSNYAAD